jgi:S-adenosylmethionine/arginine decarboxylase-like enzyme
MAIDVFTCGKESRPQKALDYLRQVLTPKSVKVQHIKRGIA